MKAPDFVEVLHNRTPHWRLPGSVYFITWCLRQGLPDLRPLERSLVATAIRHFHTQRYQLFAYVVMNDHVHILLKPLGDWQLSGIIHSLKSYTTNRLQREFGRQGSIWLKDYIDRIMRDADEVWEKANYIVNNAEKRWPGTKDYEWAEWFPWDR